MTTGKTLQQPASCRLTDKTCRYPRQLVWDFDHRPPTIWDTRRRCMSVAVSPWRPRCFSRRLRRCLDFSCPWTSTVPGCSRPPRHARATVHRSTRRRHLFPATSAFRPSSTDPMTRSPTGSVGRWGTTTQPTPRL